MEVVKRGPGRPPKIQQVSASFEQDPSVNLAETEIQTNEKQLKTLAKTVHLGIGCDLLGSMTSLSSSRGNELEVTDRGVIAKSKKNGRRVLIPWSNIRGCELAPE